MASISIALSLLQQQQPISIQTVIPSKHRLSSSLRVFSAKFERNSSYCYVKWNPQKIGKRFLLSVCCCSSENPENGRFGSNGVEGLGKFVSSLQGTIGTLTPVLNGIKGQVGKNYAVGLCIAIAFLLITIRAYTSRKSGYNRQGSVADLVKRGQLRSDRRGISKPLKYDDPFNNPLVKISENNSSVEMCGKVYRLAPVTLTEREQSNHQKRRSRAYQWKRPTMFIKEGDSIPPDVDPDTVRWIPANHPFATTVSDIDEGLAQNNVYQKHGVPFRIKAEHEALQRKLEALQNDQKLDKLGVDPSNARDFERPYKSFSKSNEHLEQRPSLNQNSNSTSPKSDRHPNTPNDNSSSEELQKP
ncbi:hypothetical protein GIB67_026743 [Kingdonia uniflora]|uniref:Protein MULTIPLE CHLOROPLAST DIVISION SITE 1 n=1 Tax=Kingdonia uniflora TaxID=39325 RepID=A0A7J7MHE5_9MAGN|nr:hypothetical protein GIB67_026743 [Kingdonia uniflora]